MDVVAKIPEEERKAKRVEISSKHNLPGARDSFAQGLKDRIVSSMHIQRSNKANSIISASTKVVYINDQFPSLPD